MGFSTCWKCKIKFWMPDDLEEVARRRGDVQVFCANGHPGVFSGKDVQTELERERDRLKQALAQKDDEIRYQQGQREQAERRLNATRGVVTRIKNRVGHGVCPCCNRTFTDLQRHMHSKHPAYPKEQLEAAE
jgi:hypothetical protein